jgi:hypothetical protein
MVLIVGHWDFSPDCGFSSVGNTRPISNRLPDIAPPFDQGSPTYSPTFPA